MPDYSKKSRSKLDTCHPTLRRVFEVVVKRYDNTILEGHREKDVQNEYFRLGKSKVKFPWGKHNTKPSEAVDASPYPIPEKWGEYDKDATAEQINDAWKERAHFYVFAGMVIQEGYNQGIVIRWGGDWDGDRDFRDQSFDDLVHFEIERFL